MKFKRTTFIVAAFIFSVLGADNSFSAPCPQDQVSTDPAENTQLSKSLAGKWQTAFGPLLIEINNNHATGTYRNGTLRGTVSNSKLNFSYTQISSSGVGEFQLSDDGQSFKGKWRSNNEQQWRPWNGKRTQGESQFTGLWSTRYGKMRLHQTKDEIVGNYGSVNYENRIEGSIKNGRFEFRYFEPGVTGIGWFEMSEDGQKISGQWHPDGVENWSNWSGDRVHAAPGKIWLVVLEADWETALAEPEYSFADMLEHYFKMSTARHVQFRKRSFHDQRDLVRFCREVKYLAEPVVLLISSHGTQNGVAVGREIINAETLANAVKGSCNIKLLHLSGCAMMSGNYPDEIFEYLGKQAYFPISGYKAIVGWDASAIGDFTYLSMLLIHRLVPQAAVKQAIKVAPYLSDQPVWGARYQALGLTLKSPPAPVKPQSITKPESQPKQSAK